MTACPPDFLLCSCRFSRSLRSFLNLSISKKRINPYSGDRATIDVNVRLKFHVFVLYYRFVKFWCAVILTPNSSNSISVSHPKLHNVAINGSFWNAGFCPEQFAEHVADFGVHACIFS